MFEQFKEKFQAVQQDFTDGIKNLSVKAQNVGKPNRGPDSFHPKQDILPGLRDGLHLSAGADLLDRFQGNWTKIHEDLEKSARKADETEKVVKGIGVAQQKRLAQWQGIKKQLSDIPSIVQDIQKITAKIGSLATDFDEVETLLIELEDVLEEEEQRKNERVQQTELERYKQQRIYEENLLKDRLLDEFNERLQERQREEDDKMRERQRAFQDFFDDDLKHYKEFGQVQRSLDVSSPESHLEDFELEWDEHDQQELDDFLGPDTAQRVAKIPASQESSSRQPPPSSDTPQRSARDNVEGGLSENEGSKEDVQTPEGTREPADHIEHSSTEEDVAVTSGTTDNRTNSEERLELPSSEGPVSDIEEAKTVMGVKDEKAGLVGDSECPTASRTDQAVNGVPETTDSIGEETPSLPKEDIPETTKPKDPSEAGEDSDDFQDAIDE